MADLKDDEEQIPEIVKDVVKPGFWTRFRNLMQLLFWVAGGIGALGFGGKKLTHYGDEDQGRAPDSVSSPNTPGYVPAPYIIAGLAEFRKEYDITIKGVRDEQQISREERKKLGEMQEVLRREGREDIKEVKRDVARLNDKMDRILEWIERQPKKWSGVEIVNPETKAN